MNARKHYDIILAAILLAASVATLISVDDNDVRGIALTIGTGLATYLVGAFRPKPNGIDESLHHGDIDFINEEDHGDDTEG